MFDRDGWREIWAVLRANRLRTLLTAFGVVWGIFMLIAMLGFGSSIQTGSQRQMKGMATNLLFVWGQLTTQPFDGLPIGREVALKTSDIDVLRNLPSVEWLAPRLQLGGWMNNFKVIYNGKSGTYNVFGDYPDFKHIVSFEYEAGRFINDRDISDQRKVAVIGHAVVDELYPAGANPIGTYLQIRGAYFEVVGVTRTLRGGQQGDRDAHSIFVPFSTLKNSFHTGDRVGFFAMTAKPGSDGPELERQVREALNRQHRVSPTDELAIGSFNAFVMFSKFENFFFVLAAVSWTVGTMTLLAGVVSVSNIMLITVKERTKEIGVRKALGATPRSIVAMILKESIALTAIAGFVGVCWGTSLLLLAGWAFENAKDIPFGPPDLNITTMIVATTVIIVCGALAGIIPAAHAASIKPIEALRAD